MAQHGRPSAARGRGPHFRCRAEAVLGVGGVHSTVCTHQTTERVGREGTLVRGVSQGAKGREIGVSLATPLKLRRLREALYTKAKQERHKVPARGTKRFTVDVVFGELGVFQLRRFHLGSPAHARV